MLAHNAHTVYSLKYVIAIIIIANCNVKADAKILALFLTMLCPRLQHRNSCQYSCSIPDCVVPTVWVVCTHVLYSDCHCTVLLCSVYTTCTVYTIHVIQPIRKLKAVDGHTIRQTECLQTIVVKWLLSVHIHIDHTLYFSQHELRECVTSANRFLEICIHVANI